MDIHSRIQKFRVSIDNFKRQAQSENLGHKVTFQILEAIQKMEEVTNGFEWKAMRPVKLG